jgi:hypothetical protein
MGCSIEHVECERGCHFNFYLNLYQDIEESDEINLAEFQSNTDLEANDMNRIPRLNGAVSAEFDSHIKEILRYEPKDHFV